MTSAIQVMATTTIRVWKTDELCPACDAPLILTQPGGSARLGCPACAWIMTCPAQMKR